MTTKDKKRQTKTGDGNTEASPLEKRLWFFTYNNYKKTDIIVLQTWLDSIKCEYMFQEEKGEQGTKHLQGVVGFKSAKSLSTLHAINKAIHWEVCRNKKDAIAYCCKADTRNGKVYNKGFEIPKAPEPIEDKLADESICYEWQQEVIDLAKCKPCPRTIHWWWSEEGGTGKTDLQRHLCLKYDATLVGARGTDMKYAITQLSLKNKPIKIIMINVPFDEVFEEYGALEEIKDGLFFNGKYESGMVIFNKPHIFIFANRPPNEKRMANLRFDITEVKKPKKKTAQAIPNELVALLS